MSFQRLEITINFNDKSELYRPPPSFLIYQRTSSWCSCRSWTGKWLSFMRNGLSNETRQRHPAKISPHRAILPSLSQASDQGTYSGINVLLIIKCHRVTFFILIPWIMNTSPANTNFIQTYEIKWQERYINLSRLLHQVQYP